MAPIMCDATGGESMATANDKRAATGSMSNEAYEVIQCFYDGVDVVVRELAEEIAADRGSFLEDDPNVVAIEVQDVREAGRRVINALRQLLKDDRLPRELEEAIGDMGQCFENH